MELKTEVTKIADGDLDLLFGTKSGTDSILGSKEQKEKELLKEELVKELEVKDESDLFKDRTDELNDVLFGGEKEKKEKVEPLKTEEDTFKDSLISEEKKEEKSNSNNVLKEIVDFYIEEKIWVLFEGQDEIEYNDENFKKILLAQNEIKAQEIFEDLVEKSGLVGKAIFDFISKNGDLDEIIDLFKLEKEVKSIDISTPEDQEKLIYQYFSEEEFGWSKDKIKRYVDNLKLDNELESEAKDIKGKYDKLFEKRLSQINEEQESYELERQKRVEDYKKNVITTLKNKQNITDKEKSKIADYMLNYDQKLLDGQVVNKFFVKFSSLQNNIEEFVDLVEFVMDKESYLKKISKKAESEANKKAFTFIKNGNSLTNKNSGSELSKAKVDDFVNLFEFIK